MNLWEDTYDRCHPNSAPSVPPNFNNQWPSGFGSGGEEILDDTFSGSPDLNTERLTSSSDFEIQDEQKIGAASMEEARDALSQVGIDAVALYAPIHFFGKRQWGVYIHERRFYGLCWSIFDLLNKPDWNILVADVHKALMLHEYFHSAVELFSLVFEDFASYLGQPCAFDEYFKQVYEPSYPTDNCLEELHATASEFRSRYLTRGLFGALSTVTSSFPDAYSKWGDYRDAPSFYNGVQALALVIRETGEGLSNHSSPNQVLWYPPRLLYSKLSPGRIGRLWFPPLTPAALDQLGPVPRWIYRSGGVTSERTLKKSFPSIKMKKLIKFLRSQYRVSVMAGTHHPKFVFPNGCIVPYSRSAVEVKPYLIKQIAAVLGIEKQELVKLLTEMVN